MLKIHLITALFISIVGIVIYIISGCNDMQSFIVTLIVWFTVFASLNEYAARYEKRNYNNGICIHCRNKLRCSGIDPQGSRNYICDRCGYATQVSYPID